MKKGLALGLVLLYLLPSVAAARISSRWWYERGRQVRALVLGVDRAHQLHPGKPILLTGIEDALFWSGVYDRPFRLLLGPPEVYLAPGAESSIREKPEGGLGDYSLPAVIAKRLLEHDEAVVYEAGGERLRNVTSRYRDHISPAWPEDAPRYVNIGSRWYGSLLGPGWHADEGGYRWMGSRAEVTVGAPPSAGMSVYVTGYATPENLVNGGQPFVVKVESRTVLETRVEKAGRFDVSGPLPPGLEKLTQLRVEFSTSRTFRPPQESRDLGLAFGEVAVR
jgi:hypothetical protein